VPVKTLPQFTLATLPTPLVRAERLERAIDSGPLWVKRDDLTGFAVAGNKARALERLLGAAVAANADVLVAVGSPTSNFCAAAAMAASRAGLACHLLFPGPMPSERSVNVELARAAGAVLHFDVVPTREELDAALLVHAESLAAQGFRPYAVPRGGATAVGASGYADAALELSTQCEAAGIAPRLVVVSTGSGGTQAGLVAGQVGHALPWRVVGASVSRPADAASEQVLRLARECNTLLGLPLPEASDVDVREARGAGFGIASDQDRLSAALALKHEGLLLDPYYGAKAMTLLRSMASPDESIVLWHTGGVSAALSALTSTDGGAAVPAQPNQGAPA